MLIRAINRLSRLGGYLAMLLLASGVLVICQMIFVRYVLNESTAWQTEYVIYALVAATFLGCAYVLQLNGHVGVDLLPSALGPRAGRWLQRLADLLSLSFCALLGWSSWNHFHEAWAYDWTTDTVWALPLWIPLLPMPVGIGLLCLQYLARLLQPEEQGA